MALIQSVRGKDYLTFDSEKHIYTLNGSIVPGVTTINRCYPENPWLGAWKIGEGAKYVLANKDRCVSEEETKAVLKEAKTAYKKVAQDAADVGAVVHSYCEAIEQGLPFDEQAITGYVGYEKIKKCIDRFKEWKAENKDEILRSEAIVGSVAHSYAGCFDRLSRRGKRVILSDWKTSSGIHLEYWLQLSAYVLAVKEWMDIDVDGMEIIRFGKDGKFETEIVTKKSEIKDFTAQFLRNLQTYRFREAYDKF